jgi:transcriptional regulator with XRE-family HTH domain
MNGMSSPQAQDGPPPLRAAFGRELAHWREQRGKTQAGLARRLVEEHWLEECSQSYVAHVEAGRKPPPRGMADGADALLETGGALARLWPWVDQEERARRQRRAKQPEHESRRRVGPQPRVQALEQVGRGLRDDAALAARDMGYFGPFPVMFSDGRVEYMQIPRRAFLAAGSFGLAASLTGGRLHADDLERLDLAIETPERVDMPVVGYFRAVLTDHRKADDVIGPQYLRVPVVVQLAMVKRFISAAKDSKVKQELQRVGGEYSQFAWWLALDTEDLAAADQHFDRARAWALDAGDNSLMGYLYALKSGGILATGGNPAEARQAAEVALRPEYRTTPGVRAHAAMRTARTLAMTGDLAQCQAKLEEAKTLVKSIDHAQEPSWLYWFNEAGPAFQAGVCFDHIGRPDLALPEFAAALQALPPPQKRDRGEFLTRKSAAHARADDPEQAASIAGEALQLVSETGSARNLSLLRDVAARLNKWADLPAVRDLTEQLNTVA